MNRDVVLEMKGIIMEFPGVKALDNIDLTLKKGRVHALLGENGAGKSTLMKVLSGIYKPAAGMIFIEGEKVDIHNTKEAQGLGISIIHQELNMCNNLTVTDNIFLGKEIYGLFGKLNKREMNKEARKLLDKLGATYIDEKALISQLSVAQQQLVEITKATSVNSKIMIMDEPTSSLTDKEIVILFEIIRQLKADGVAVVYISHKLEEIFEICDDITVIRDGQYIGSTTVKEATVDKLIQMMVGRSLENMYETSFEEKQSSDEIILEAKNVKWGRQVKNVSLYLQKGEILGIYGLVGAGRTEFVKTLFAYEKMESGEVYIEGKRVKLHSPKDAIKKGLALVTEDRKQEGLALKLSVKENIMSSNLDQVTGALSLVKEKKEAQIAKEGIEKLSVKTPSENFIVNNLSGGNQQKVILAKWLAGHPKILILDEPTRGIDVGAKAEIYHIMHSLVKQGISILMISSEMPEIIGMSDRIAVMREGVITGVLENVELTQEKILTLATGGM